MTTTATPNASRPFTHADVYAAMANVTYISQGDGDTVPTYGPVSVGDVLYYESLDYTAAEGGTVRSIHDMGGGAYLLVEDDDGAWHIVTVDAESENVVRDTWGGKVNTLVWSYHLEMMDPADVVRCATDD